MRNLSPILLLLALTQAHPAQAQTVTPVTSSAGASWSTSGHAGSGISSTGLFGASSAGASWSPTGVVSGFSSAGLKSRSSTGLMSASLAQLGPVARSAQRKVGVTSSVAGTIVANNGSSIAVLTAQHQFYRVWITLNPYNALTFRPGSSFNGTLRSDPSGIYNLVSASTVQ